MQDSTKDARFHGKTWIMIGTASYPTKEETKAAAECPKKSTTSG
jgi:hypothetical protein